VPIHLASRASSLLLIGLALVGCAGTPLVYGPIKPEISHYGYRETANADGTFTLLVVAPGREIAREFWEKRASELCRGPNFTRNIFRAEIQMVYANYNDTYGDAILEGYLRCTDTPPPLTAPVEDGASSDQEAVTNPGS
jgi:hypothetical protein